MCLLVLVIILGLCWNVCKQPVYFVSEIYSHMIYMMGKKVLIRRKLCEDGTYGIMHNVQMFRVLCFK